MYTSRSPSDIYLQDCSSNSPESRCVLANSSELPKELVNKSPVPHILAFWVVDDIKPIDALLPALGKKDNAIVLKSNLLSNWRDTAGKTPRRLAGCRAREGLTSPSNLTSSAACTSPPARNIGARRAALTRRPGARLPRQGSMLCFPRRPQLFRHFRVHVFIQVEEELRLGQAPPPAALSDSAHTRSQRQSPLGVHDNTPRRRRFGRAIDHISQR